MRKRNEDALSGGDDLAEFRGLSGRIRQGRGEILEGLVCPILWVMGTIAV